MAFTQIDLATLDLAIASGELSVSHNGRSVTYRSMDDLIKARDRIADALRLDGAGSRRTTHRYTFLTGRGE